MDVDDDDVREDDDEEDPEGENADETLEENKPVEEEILVDQQGIIIIFVIIYIIKLFGHLFIFVHVSYSGPNGWTELSDSFRANPSKFLFFKNQMFLFWSRIFFFCKILIFSRAIFF